MDLGKLRLERGVSEPWTPYLFCRSQDKPLGIPTPLSILHLVFILLQTVITLSIIGYFYKRVVFRLQGLISRSIGVLVND